MFISLLASGIVVTQGSGDIPALPVSNGQIARFILLPPKVHRALKQLTCTGFVVTADN